jgi:hypothetical protein
MDPNEALKYAREALEEYRISQGGFDNAGERSDAADSLSSAFEALDGWLSKGGFLPEAWADASYKRLDALADEDEAKR